MRKSRALYVAAKTMTTASSTPSTPHRTVVTHRRPAVVPRSSWSADTRSMLSAAGHPAVGYAAVGYRSAGQQQGGERVGDELVPAGVGVDPVRPEQRRVGRPGHRPHVQADRAPARRLLPDD